MKILQFFKKASVPKEIPNIPSEPLALFRALDETSERGYEQFISTLSDRAVIRFSVPTPVLNEMIESEEWKAFLVLLEKYQTEYVQKQHLTDECLWEV